MKRDIKTYNEEQILVGYICRYYKHLMTDFEKDVLSAIDARRKASVTNSPSIKAKIFERWGKTGDSSINEALSAGYDDFRQRTTKRLLTECLDEIYINRCPQCNRIVRTPRAEQCQWCYHDWYSKQDEY